MENVSLNYNYNCFLLYIYDRLMLCHVNMIIFCRVNADNKAVLFKETYKIKP